MDDHKKRKEPMPEVQPTMPEWLQAKRQLEQKLKDAGITEEQYIELFGLLDTVTGADPEQIRNQQFQNDARDLCVEVQAAYKNASKGSAFLRRFAVHVARCLLPEQERIEELVDSIPEMFQREQ
jgi:hypothetical protein